MSTQAQSSKKYGGRLEKWWKEGDRVCGKLYSDPSERFPEGAEVVTSSVVGLVGGILETLNTIYELGEPYVK